MDSQGNSAGHPSQLAMENEPVAPVAGRNQARTFSVEPRTLEMVEDLGKALEEGERLRSESSRIRKRMASEKQRYDRSQKNPPSLVLTDEQLALLTASLEALRGEREAIEEKLVEHSRSVERYYKTIATLFLRLTRSKPAGGGITQGSGHQGDERRPERNPVPIRNFQQGIRGDFEAYSDGASDGPADFDPTRQDELTELEQMSEEDLKLAQSQLQRAYEYAQDQFREYPHDDYLEIASDESYPEPRVRHHALHTGLKVFEKESERWEQDPSLKRLPLVDVDSSIFDEEYSPFTIRGRHQRIKEWNHQRQQAWAGTYRQHLCARNLKRARRDSMPDLESPYETGRESVLSFPPPDVLNLQNADRTTYQENDTKRFLDAYEKEETNRYILSSSGPPSEDEYGERYYTPRKHGKGIRWHAIGRPPKTDFIPRNVNLDGNEDGMDQDHDQLAPQPPAPNVRPTTRSARAQFGKFDMYRTFKKQGGCN